MKFLVKMCLILIVSMSFGCISSQKLNLGAEGFVENEFIAIQAKSLDELGRLYTASVQKGKEGEDIPLKWKETSLLLFPVSTDANTFNTERQMQTRQAIEVVGASNKVTSSSLIGITVTNDFAFKFQSKTDSARKLSFPLKFNPKTKEFMKNKLKSEPNIKFAYIDKFYSGAAFIQLYNNQELNWFGGEAAFKIEGKYYNSSDRSVVTAGNVIFSLSEIDVEELIDDPQNNRVRELSEKVIADLPVRVESDGSGQSYNILESGKYIIRLKDRLLGRKSEASLCISGTNPPINSCRHIESWYGDWEIELSKGHQLRIFTKEGNNAAGMASTGRIGGIVSILGFQDGDFVASFELVKK